MTFVCWWMMQHNSCFCGDAPFLTPCIFQTFLCAQPSMEKTERPFIELFLFVCLFQFGHKIQMSIHLMSSVKIEIHFVNDLWNCLRARFLRFIKTVMLSSMSRNSWTTLFFKPEKKFGFHMSSISEACWWISGNTCNSGLVYLTFRVWQW